MIIMDGSTYFLQLEIVTNDSYNVDVKKLFYKLEKLFYLQFGQINDLFFSFYREINLKIEILIILALLLTVSDLFSYVN